MCGAASGVSAYMTHFEGSRQRRDQLKAALGGSSNDGEANAAVYGGAPAAAAHAARQRPFRPRHRAAQRAAPVPAAVRGVHGGVDVVMDTDDDEDPGPERVQAQPRKRASDQLGARRTARPVRVARRLPFSPSSSRRLRAPGTSRSRCVRSRSLSLSHRWQAARRRKAAVLDDDDDDDDDFEDEQGGSSDGEKDTEDSGDTEEDDSEAEVELDDDSPQNGAVDLSPPSPGSVEAAHQRGAGPELQRVLRAEVRGGRSQLLVKFRGAARGAARAGRR